MKTKKEQWGRKGRIWSPVKEKALLLLLTGVTLGLTHNPRRQRYIFKALTHGWKEINRRYLYRAVHEFRRDRLVDYREQAGGTIKIVLTEKGKQRALAFNLDSMKIERPRHWDGKWRIVISDVPEKKRLIRDALREKLRGLGFHEWQKSVFIFPYPCRDQIDFLVEFFEARSYVRQGELTNPTNEAELKLLFNLT